MFEIMSREELTTVFRLFLALICGGTLGFERGRKKRPAGFRTYMLVCVGAALVMMTNEYIFTKYGTSDPSRMGAQVISGIGFLGAGTIIVTGHNRVKGLTTAAGLWAAACIGLAVGIGFYIGAILGTIMIFLAMGVLHNIDDRVMASSKVVNLYIEFVDTTDIKNIITFAKENEIKITDMEIDHSKSVQDTGMAVLLTMRLRRKMSHSTLLQTITLVDGVIYAEEI